MNKKKENNSELIFYTVPLKPGLPIKLVEECVPAGFPSPADNYIQDELDLNQLLIKNPPATFFVRVIGDSMINAGISPGDILVVDKSLEAKNKDIIIAVVNGEFTVKRLLNNNGHVLLFPENNFYSPLEITSDMDLEVWGVVTSVIHKVR